MAVLFAVERGELGVELPADLSALRHGYPVYRLSNGWRIRVYVSDGRWHHLHCMWTETGAVIDPWELYWTDELARLRDYAPPVSVAWRAYHVDPVS